MYEEDDDSDQYHSEYSGLSIQSSRDFNTLKAQRKQGILQFYDAQPQLPFETEVIASQIFDILFTKGGNKLYEKYLFSKMPDFQAKETDGILSALINQGLMLGDEGESAEELDIFWVEEKEPKVLHYDSRSTYAVNIDFKQIIIDETEHDDSDAKSIVSNSSRFSFASRKTNKLLSVSTKIMTANKLNQSMSELNMKKIKGDKQYQPELVRMPDEAPPEPDPIADRLRLAREKKDYVKSLEMEKQRKQMQDELDFENKKIEAQKLLKHKQFTHDFNGNIIFLKKDRDSIPIPSNMVNLDAKNRLPSEITKETKPPDEEGKKVKQMNFKSKEKQKIFETLEFHNQPLLYNTFKPNPGSKLKTVQGQLKEGGFLTIQNRMRKEEYDKMVESLPNRPVANYLGSTLSQKNQQIQIDEINEWKQPRLSLHSSSQMRIFNKDALVDMLAEHKKNRKNSHNSSGNIQMNTKHSDKSIGELREEYLIREKEKQEKQRKIKELSKQVKLEKVTLYPQAEKIEEGMELGFISIIQPNSKKKEPITRLHLEVEKFDQKNIKDPTWGDSNATKSQQSALFDDNKKSVREPVNFKIRKQQKLINSNQSIRITASKFFNS